MTIRPLLCGSKRTVVLASFQAFSHGYYARVLPALVLLVCRFALNTPFFCVWNRVYNRGGLNPGYNSP